ncbi:hypothetical protein GGF32_010099 [Allomyces javanicus]|nr:hypothetical protein GGF32_010099 [Allomyces javanicus]
MARPSSSAPAFRRPDPPAPSSLRRASAIPPHITADQTRALVVGRLPRCVHERDWPTLSNELVALLNALAAPRAVTDIEPLRICVRERDASTELVAAAFVQLQTAEAAERVAAWGKKTRAVKIATYCAAEWYVKEVEYLARLDASALPARPDSQPAAASSSRAAPTAKVAKPTASASAPASSAPAPPPTPAPAAAPSSAPAPAPAPSQPAPSQPASAAATGPTATTTAPPPPPATFPAARLRVRGITPNPRHTSLRRFLGRPGLPIAVAPDPTNRNMYLADYATAAAAHATVRYFEENMVVHKNAKDAVGRIVPPRDALAAAKRVQIEWVFGEPIVPFGMAAVLGILASAQEVGDAQPLPVKGKRKRKRRHAVQRDEGQEMQVGESEAAAAPASARSEPEASSAAAAPSSSTVAASSLATAPPSAATAPPSSATAASRSAAAGKRAAKRKRSGSEADDEGDQERRPAKRAATEQSWGSRMWDSCIIC